MATDAMLATVEMRVRTRRSRPSGASIVPARAPVYLEATIDPEGETADEIKALSQKLAGTDKPGAELKRLFEQSVNEDGGSFKWDEEKLAFRPGTVTGEVSDLETDFDEQPLEPSEQRSWFAMRPT